MPIYNLTKKVNIMSITYNTTQEVDVEVEFEPRELMDMLEGEISDEGILKYMDITNTAMLEVMQQRSYSDKSVKDQIIETLTDMMAYDEIAELLATEAMCNVIKKRMDDGKDDLPEVFSMLDLRSPPVDVFEGGDDLWNVMTPKQQANMVMFLINRLTK
jgi:hypothetical protein